MLSSCRRWSMAAIMRPQRRTFITKGSALVGTCGGTAGEGSILRSFLCFVFIFVHFVVYFHFWHKWRLRRVRALFTLCTRFAQDK